MAHRKLVVCCDGTWQKINVTYPTNVVKVKSAIEGAQEPGQIVYYHPGLGTENWFTKLFGGMFGIGLDKDIRECYQWLCSTYQPDDYLYLFGFSRGAYTVRSLGGLLYKCGILRASDKKNAKNALDFYRDRDIHPDDPRAVDFRKNNSVAHPANDNRPFVTFIGCWDTVGSLGVPDLNPRWKLDEEINKPFQFHDTKLSRIVKNARHAVALDEHRKVFNVTPMELSDGALQSGTVLKQFWFAGDHGCVGGGNKDKEPLSDITLDWIAGEAMRLEGDYALKMDARGLPGGGTFSYNSPFFEDTRDMTRELGLINRKTTDSFDELYWSVKARLRDDPGYAPCDVREKFKDEISAFLLKA
jgi:uncharacterized protein (DUF2235 family)